jgi:hypothetical protein
MTYCRHATLLPTVSGSLIQVTKPTMLQPTLLNYYAH